MEKQILLASQSPRRVRLLTEAGYQVEVMPSHADEKDASHDDIHDIVEANAKIKGDEVISRLKESGRQFQEGWVLVAADTLVVMGQKVYPKPKDMDEALAFQLELGGCVHQVFTGVFVYDLYRGEGKTFHVTTDVVLKKRSVEDIQETFKVVNPLDKAGAYGFQDSREIVERMDGSETNVIGLPMEALQDQLDNF